MVVQKVGTTSEEHNTSNCRVQDADTKLDSLMAMLCCIHEVLGSTLGQNTGYPVFFMVFSVPPHKCSSSTSIKPHLFLSKS
jgi:hypothetical protein